MLSVQQLSDAIERGSSSATLVISSLLWERCLPVELLEVLACASKHKELRLGFLANRVLAKSAEDLSSEQVDEFEASLERDPAQLALRLLLTMYYWRDRRDRLAAHGRFVTHLLWLFRHHPDAELLSEPEGRLSPSHHAEFIPVASELWVGHLSKVSTNVNVIANAAHFFSMIDVRRALQLYQSALALDAAEQRWARWIAVLTSQLVQSREESGENIKAIGTTSIATLEESLRLAIGTSERATLLVELAKTAFQIRDLNKAHVTASEAVRLADLTQQVQPEGDAIHQAHTILRLVATNTGDLEKAKALLKQSASISPSPALRTFGPSMRLANELLALGECESVISYLNQCSEF